MDNSNKKPFQFAQANHQLPRKHKLPNFKAQTSPKVPKLGSNNTDINQLSWHSRFPAPDVPVSENIKLKSNSTNVFGHRGVQQNHTVTRLTNCGSQSEEFNGRPWGFMCGAPDVPVSENTKLKSNFTNAPTFGYQGILQNHTVTSLTDYGSQSEEFSYLPPKELVSVPNTDINVSENLLNKPLNNTINTLGKKSSEYGQFDFLLQIFTDVILKMKCKLSNSVLVRLITETFGMGNYPKLKTNKEKQLAYKQAEENGQLIECGCCYQMVLFEDCGACNEGDLFCKACIQKSAEIRIGDGYTTFPCLQDCGSNFPLECLQTMLDAKTILMVSKRIQHNEIESAGIEGLEGCPFCEYAYIPPPDTKIFTCLNPECLKESCRNCHKESHIPLRCEEVESDTEAKARKYIEEEMTKELVRECYKCKRNFIKIDGCNKMKCRCGAMMCYICRQPVTGYLHFYDGPNRSKSRKCPLFSTNKSLHVDAVKAVAAKALKAVKTRNPKLKLKHDPTKVRRRRK